MIPIYQEIQIKQGKVIKNLNLGCLDGWIFELLIKYFDNRLLFYQDCLRKTYNNCDPKGR